MEAKRGAGALYLVATPIGNLEDITLRALRILREADIVAAEDTRHTHKLLAHSGIETPLIAYHQHSSEGRTENLIRRMQAGQSIALVTDAGTPGVSDPGHALVCAAIDAGITVVPIPGASAALCALVASGIPPARFAFEGFLPRTKSSRTAKLTALARTETRTLIFFEAGNRTAATVAEMAAAFGPTRPAAVCRELTKKHEEFIRGGLGDLAARLAAGEVRGEVTIVVAGLDDAGAEVVAPAAEQTLEDAIDSARAQGLSDRDAARAISAARGLSRRDVYAAILARKDQPDRD